MGLFNTIKKQLRSVIEWENPSKEEIFHLWSKNGDEIKNASKLIINPGQGAIFVYEGKVQAVHNEEGMYDLTTGNIPFLTTLSRLMQSFESEHKVAIYFFWKTEILNLKWGTISPIKYEDPVYKFPVGLQAFGNYSLKIAQPENFFVNVMGDSEGFTMEQIRTVISDRLIQPLTDCIAEAGYSYAEIDKQRNELAQKSIAVLGTIFSDLGFALTDFRIESTSFDDATNERINTISNITAEAMGAQKAGINYAEYQKLQALRDAAKNEGGMAGAGVGLGAGIGMGQAMTGGFVNTPQTPVAPAAPSVEERLTKLKNLFDNQLITEDEYAQKKTNILNEL